MVDSFLELEEGFEFRDRGINCFVRLTASINLSSSRFFCC